MGVDFEAKINEFTIREGREMGREEWETKSPLTGAGKGERGEVEGWFFKEGEKGFGAELKDEVCYSVGVSAFTDDVQNWIYLDTLEVRRS